MRITGNKQLFALTVGNLWLGCITGNRSCAVLKKIKMDDILQKILIAILSLLSGIVLGFVSHFLSKRRDLYNKKKEIRIKYLIEDYKRIERGSMPVSKRYDKGEFEEAIADIPLFGKSKQVKIAHDFARLASEGNGNLQKLLESLSITQQHTPILPVVQDTKDPAQYHFCLPRVQLIPWQLTHPCDFPVAIFSHF